MSIDWTKPIQTRDGRPARLLGHIDAQQPVVVAYVNDKEGETVEAFHTDGRYYLYEVDGESKFDIVNVPTDPVSELLELINQQYYAATEAAQRTARKNVYTKATEVRALRAKEKQS